MTQDAADRNRDNRQAGIAKLFATSSRAAPAVLRVVLGGVMFAHGAQKLLGWFGGGGFGATMDHFTQGQGLPWMVAFAVILIEFFGAIGLVLGVATRLCAAGIAAVMVGAVLTVHLQYGFFMNWSGASAGEGFEYHLLVLAIVVAVMIAGGGAASVDGRLTD